MVHVSETVFQSFIQTVIASGSFQVSKFMQDSFISKKFTYGDDFICKLDKTVCNAKPADTPIDFSMKLSDDAFFTLKENKILFNSTVEFAMLNEDGSLITDFELDNVALDLDVWSEPLYTRVNGNFNNWRFYGAKVNEQGSVYVDPREVRRDDSYSFDDIQQSIQWYFRQWKQIDEVTFFDEF